MISQNEEEDTKRQPCLNGGIKAAALRLTVSLTVRLNQAAATRTKYKKVLSAISDGGMGLHAKAAL